MAQIGVLRCVLSGADPQFLAPLVHIGASEPQSWLARLAVMGGEDVQAALRLSKAETDVYQTLRAEMGTTLKPAALGWQFGQAIASDVIYLRAAMFETALPPDWRADIDRGVAATCPITAADLMPALSGPALGQKLRDLQSRWLQSDLTLTKAQLLS
jgi:poly(A) polymerase